ncbi:YjiH family protein [Psychrobacter nivimaris]|uniref:YjiH family protein n=1 Tax=Psychrobacter nivimaris TaxID=281738 RepID=UPI0037357A19
MNKKVEKFSTQEVLKFIIPSLIGAMLFMLPIKLEDRFTVPIAVLIDALNDMISPYMLAISLIVAVIPSVISLTITLFNLWPNSTNRIINIFKPGLIWSIVRILGAITMVLVYFKVGPEWIWSEYTGGILLNEVAPILLALYFVSAILLPLLTEFGLMEFVGTLLNKTFSKAFGLPGNAAIDSMASWLSATSLGVILTTQQYRGGHYTKREAAAIMTSFSVVSVGFSYVVLKFVKMEDFFIPWYFSVVLAGICCALIIPRLPPLRNIPSEYMEGVKRPNIDNVQEEGESLFGWAFRRALLRAKSADPISKQISDGVYTATDLAITVYPSMMIVGVLGLSLIEYTNIMSYISIPLVPILELLQLPEADAAAIAIMSGFIDLLMPVIIGSSIESELTRFVIAGVTVNSIIFLSEVALIMMKAQIGLNVWRLFVIWVLRLMIALPIMTIMGNLII